MLRSMNDLQGFTIGATDGDTGRVDAFYFDGTSFTVRHLVVDTSGWLTGRKVLISPMALRAVDWDGRRIEAELTKSQVEQSPDIDTAQPVSRQQEINYYRYYGYPQYWEGPYLWGLGPYPVVTPEGAAAKYERRWEWGESARRSAPQELRPGHRVLHPGDGRRYRSRRGFPRGRLVLGDSLHGRGHAQLVAGQEGAGVARVDQGRRLERLEGARGRDAGADKKSPEYDPSGPIERDYETRLHDYYGQPSYWSDRRDKGIMR
jgi:hypothetical protein